MTIKKRDRIIFPVREKKSLRELLKGPRITKQKIVSTLPVMKQVAYDRLVRRLGDQLSF